MTPKIGIAVAANNIGTKTIKAFKESACNALGESDHLYIAQGDTFGPYNKSRHINDGIRHLLSMDCDIIVQTDLDIDFKRSIVEETRSKTVSGTHFWNPFIKDGRIRKTAKGSWNALTAKDWIMVGGYDERFFGWGREDDELHMRCKSYGLNTVVGKEYLFHRPHPPRRNWNDLYSPENADSSLSDIVQKKNFVNYLTDDLPEQKGITLHLTSRCVRGCKQCCLQNFMALEPDYDITENEIDSFINAVEMNPYDVHHVILCGGEPLLCPTLKYAIEQTNSCSKIKEVWLYTGLVDGFDFRSLPHIRGTIRFSFYGANDTLINQALEQGIVPKAVDKRLHTILPEKLYPESIPGTCYNPEIFVYKNRVYTCPMVAQNLTRHKIAPYDSSLYSEPLTNRLFDRMRGWKTGAMLTCTGCAGNQNFRKITGLYTNADEEK